MTLFVPLFVLDKASTMAVCPRPSLSSPDEQPPVGIECGRLRTEVIHDQEDFRTKTWTRVYGRVRRTGCGRGAVTGASVGGVLRAKPV